MLSVYICEDNQVQREKLANIVGQYIMIEDFDMKLVMVTEDPIQVLEKVKQNDQGRGLYFLDVELAHEMNGIELGSEIRKYDNFGHIVFVTTHEEMAVLTFRYKLAALDYIVKDGEDDIREKIHECLLTVVAKETEDSPKNRLFTVKVGSQLKSFRYEDILFFETAPVPHKIIIHTKNSQIEFYGEIKNLSKIGAPFLRCHKSYVVNEDCIKSVDFKRKEIEMINGEKCFVSVSALKLFRARAKGKSDNY